MRLEIAAIRGMLELAGGAEAVDVGLGGARLKEICKIGWQVFQVVVFEIISSIDEVAVVGDA